MANRKPCEPIVEVVGRENVTDAQIERAMQISAEYFVKSFPVVISDAVKQIVAARGVEPREGFVVNELSVALSNGVEVSVEGRGRGAGVSIVRWNGEVVAHAWPLNPIFKPGAWQHEIGRVIEELWQDGLQAKALPGCADCHGFGTVTDEGEHVACRCTERQQPPFAVIHGANQSQRNFNHVAEQMAA